MLFTSYRDIAGTNTSANVNRADISSPVLRARWNLARKHYSHPVNFPVKFTVQRVPENVADCWRVLWQKYLPHGFFNASARDVRVGVISARMYVHIHMNDTSQMYECTYASYANTYTDTRIHPILFLTMTMESDLLFCRVYLHCFSDE